MLSFKKHIAIALLAGFLFPQVASSMHYFVVSHSFLTESNVAFKKESSSFLYHTCHFHLNSFSSVIPSENNLKKTAFIRKQRSHNFFSLENYVHHENYNFQLRGPPFQ